jgi:hypothetical protein
MRSQYLFFTAVLLSSLELTRAHAGVCTILLSGKSPGELYVAPPNCDTPDCVQQVVLLDRNSGTSQLPLSANQTYQFLYKTTDTTVVNSLVAVQIKHLGTDQFINENKTPVRVILRREGTPFACNGKTGPFGSADDITGVESVEYERYDRFHRWRGFYASKDAYLHEKFHIYYHRDKYD